MCSTILRFRTTARRWRIRRRRIIRTPSEHHRAHPAKPSITTAPGLAGQRRQDYAQHEKRLFSISNRADRLVRLMAGPARSAFPAQKG